MEKGAKGQSTTLCSQLFNEKIQFLYEQMCVEM